MTHEPMRGKGGKGFKKGIAKMKAAIASKKQTRENRNARRRAAHATKRGANLGVRKTCIKDTQYGARGQPLARKKCRRYEGKRVYPRAQV